MRVTMHPTWQNKTDFLDKATEHTPRLSNVFWIWSLEFKEER